MVPAPLSVPVLALFESFKKSEEKNLAFLHSKLLYKEKIDKFHQPAIPLQMEITKTTCPILSSIFFDAMPVHCLQFTPELVFLNVYGAPESIPRNEFRQPV
jgi:hypothetical protein